jgi:Do/DeqQ family serine protease
MKQKTKFYGALLGVAFFSGLTGAFAYSLAQKTNEKDLPVQELAMEQPKLMRLSNTALPVSQPVDLTEAAEKACNAVVYIKCVQVSKTRTIEYQDPFADFFEEFFGRGQGGTQRRQMQTPKRESAGSGVIISEDGYIVTNNHVVENADEITITLNDNREFTARVIGLDSDTDLALLKVDATGLPAIVIGDSDNLKVGEWVLAVGNPFNLTSTVTAGIVSAKARNLRASKNGIESFIQTDAAINQGNSGGALVNVRGELVGINAMLYSQTGSFTGYGFAIPTTIMKKVVTDLRSYGTVQRAMFGISGMTLHDYVTSEKSKDSDFKADFGTVDGVYVDEVVEGGAAAEAGLKQGDIIVSVDGKEITKMSELQEVTTKYLPGDKAKVGYIREKKEKTAVITFRNAKGNTNVIKAQNIDALGAEFKELTDKQKETLNLSYGLQVVKLTSGYLKDAGMPENFIILKINNQSIKSQSDLETVFRNAQASDEQTLWIWGKTPSGRSMSFAVLLGE